MKASSFYDIIIVGGGVVGAGLAAALAPYSKRIALIDAGRLHQNDPRLFALNISSCHFLKNIGIWPALSQHAAPIDQVHVSHQGHFGTVRLSKEDISVNALGYVIPAYVIESALYEKLEALEKNPAGQFIFYRPAKLKSLSQTNNQATLTITTASGDEVLQTSLVIGCDGTNSTVRSEANIATQKFEYQQSALVVKTALQRSHRSIAYERFSADGAIAMLPLIGNECATIWTASHALIAEQIAVDEKTFIANLQKEFGYRLGKLLHIGQRHVFPLQMVQAKKPYHQCVYLIGNAAHTLHPIAAQGFNLALYEVAALVEALQAKNNNPLNSAASLTSADLMQVHAHSQRQQKIGTYVSHQLSRLFLSKPSVLGFSLQLGMISFNRLTLVKRKFIKELTGRAQYTPRLLLSANEYENFIQT